MITKYDLKIGNIIRYKKTGDIGKVVKLGGSVIIRVGKSAIIDNYKQFEGIYLSRELLLKSDMNRSYNDTLETEGFYFDGYEYVLFEGNKEVQCQRTSVFVKYFHELQNLIYTTDKNFLCINL